MLLCILPESRFVGLTRTRTVAVGVLMMIKKFRRRYNIPNQTEKNIVTPCDKTLVTDAQTKRRIKRKVSSGCHTKRRQQTDTEMSDYSLVNTYRPEDGGSKYL
jgi:hypothetical protein